MSFKASKSWSLILKKGIALEKKSFKLSGEFIPTIHGNSIKNLGKCIDSSLKDMVAIQETKANLDKWLTKVDKSGLPGHFKAWIYKHTVLLKILWLLSLNSQLPTSSRWKEKSTLHCGDGWAYQNASVAPPYMAIPKYYIFPSEV